MISLITVLLDQLNPFFEIFSKSLIENLQHVKEVIVIRIDKDKSYEEQYTKGGINFRFYGKPLVGLYRNQGQSHALALHDAIDLSTQEYIYFCDPDVFFYNPVDKIYLDLMKKHSINIIGCSHHNSVALCQSYFPYIVNCLVRKSELPTPDFLKGYLKIRNHERIAEIESYCPDDPGIPMDGKYLLPGPIPAFETSYLNQNKKNCVCDTACNLHLWANQNNWRWLSFQTIDCNKYSTIYYRNNIKLKDKLPKMNLLYHAVGASRPIPNQFPEFFQNYIRRNDD